MSDSLTITDNRTGQTYELPIVHGTIRATDLRKIKTSSHDTGLMSYDPAFMNTASCTSRITHADGERGILLYRGYPIEQLADKSNYLEVAYLLIHGELPDRWELERWQTDVTNHTYLHEHVKKFLDGFHHDAHPMAVMVSMVAALSTFYPSARNLSDPDVMRLQIVRMIAKMPTLAAWTFRHGVGMPYIYPDRSLSYAGNLLNMLFRTSEVRYVPNPVIERALDAMFILHADHEQNCSASAIRNVGSSRVDPITSLSSGLGALYGPLEGGASEEVLRMLEEIGHKKNVPEFIKKVRAGETKLMGFGHRIYKTYDPRARIVRRLADEVFEITGRNPLLDVALELERVALQEDYFASRKLFPNVDFYSGLIYQAMGFPRPMFPVLYAIARTPGWLSQWLEMYGDPEQKIARPRQLYLGHPRREYPEINNREQKELASLS